MGSTWNFGERGRPGAGALARFGCGLGLALLATAFLWPASTIGDVSQPGELAMSASGEITPIRLARSKAAPATLRLGFTSEALNSPATPELSRIVLDISRNVELHTAGLPSCSFKELYSGRASPGHSCAKSLVGHGIVDSEIMLPGKPPAKVQGHLSAFYVLRKGERRILAPVTTGAPLPFIYVIAFDMTSDRGAFGTRLVVQRMANILGVCIHPNCFSPYTLKGVYSRISKLEPSLQRRVPHGGERDSFVSARCPAPGKRTETALPVASASLK